MDYQTVRSLPIRYRRWFLERLVKDFEERKKARSGESVGTDNQSVGEKMNKLSKFEEMMSNKFK